MINIDNRKKLRNLPRGPRLFLISYLILLLATLGGFVSAAVNSRGAGLVCVVITVAAFIFNIVAAMLK